MPWHISNGIARAGRMDRQDQVSGESLFDDRCAAILKSMSSPVVSLLDLLTQADDAPPKRKALYRVKIFGLAMWVNNLLMPSGS